MPYVIQDIVNLVYNLKTVMCHMGASISTPSRSPTNARGNILDFIIYSTIYFKITHVFREDMTKLAQVKKTQCAINSVTQEEK